MVFFISGIIAKQDIFGNVTDRIAQKAGFKSKNSVCGKIIFLRFLLKKQMGIVQLYSSIVGERKFME